MPWLGLALVSNEKSLKALAYNGEADFKLTVSVSVEIEGLMM